jgi:hypothetical protein
MITIPKCYSALVASGNGAKCNELKNKINSLLLQKEQNTGQLKVILFKFGKEKHPEIVRKITKELKSTIENVVKDVDDLYFGNDLKKDKKHVSNY